ncbi:MAG TPA: DUF6285 domain-containing protein [Stellaceae bacterium]|nr:DUF6285 domain-containing protein [Stellaceae bacterium]
MIDDPPSAAELLALVRAAWERDFASLPAEQRQQQAALIVRCLAIGERTLRSAGSAAVIEHGLAQHFGMTAPEQRLERLAAAIRAGAYDRPGPAREGILRLLWAITLRKLALSNPAFTVGIGEGRG